MLKNANSLKNFATFTLITLVHHEALVLVDLRFARRFAGVVRRDGFRSNATTLSCYRVHGVRARDLNLWKHEKLLVDVENRLISVAGRHRGHSGHACMLCSNFKIGVKFQLQTYNFGLNGVSDIICRFMRTADERLKAGSAEYLGNECTATADTPSTLNSNPLTNNNKHSTE